MKAVRLFQLVFIFFGFVVVSLGLASAGEDEAAHRAAFYLLGEGFAAGLAACVITMLVLSARGAGGNFVGKLSGLMFLTLALFTVVWTAFISLAGLHPAEGIGTIGRAVRCGFGYLFGWFSVILALFARQLFFPPRSSGSDEGGSTER